MSAKKVSTLFDIFIDLNELSQGTRAIYRNSLMHLIKHIGDKKASEYTPIDAQVFAKRLSENHSNTTVNMYIRAMKAFFNWLCGSDLLKKSPFCGVRTLKVANLKKKHPYEDYEIEAMLKVCRSLRWRLIIALAITTGMRRSEILNLTVPEVDFSDGCITIQPKLDTVHTWAWNLKDHESRIVPLTPMAEGLLLKVLAALPVEQPYICLTSQRYKHLIGLRNKGELNYEKVKCPESNFTRHFKEICDRARVNYRTFHCLRSSALTILAEHGIEVHELQQIAGHSSFQTTMKHYLKPRNEMLRKVRNAAFNTGA
jgi:integrase